MNKELNIFTMRMLRDQYHAEHLDTEAEALEAAISALEQPELIEQGAYVRGFEQGRTQGMLDAKLQPTCNQLATDCISRQAAIDAMSAVNDSICEQQAIDALCELPSAQPEPQWIPCSDHTPDTPIRVQVQLDNGWIITAWYEEGDWYSIPMLYDGDDCWLTLDDVIAWRELPEPWKGEQP